MIAVLVAIVAAICVFIGGIIFLLWTVINYFQARKYRELCKALEAFEKEQKDKPVVAVPEQSSSPRYEVVYKEGKKSKKVIVTAATEALALKELGKQNIRFDNIISLDRK